MPAAPDRLGQQGKEGCDSSAGTGTRVHEHGRCTGAYWLGVQPPGKPVLYATRKCVTSKIPILSAALPVYILFRPAPTRSSCTSPRIGVLLRSPSQSSASVPLRLLPQRADPGTYPHLVSPPLAPHPAHTPLLAPRTPRSPRPTSRLAPLPRSPRWAVTWRCSSCATSQPGTWTRAAATVSPGSPPGAPATTAPGTWPTFCAPTPT